MDECDTCGQVKGYREMGGANNLQLAETLDEKCPKSERACGHHCNHVWSHDHCHWCDVEWGEES